MADDTRDNENSTESPVITGTKTGGGSRLPKGMIMGKDGKPYVLPIFTMYRAGNLRGYRCKACNTFADFRAVKLGLSSSPTSQSHTLSNSGPPPDCPPDVEVLGRSSWTLLHSLTASYPTSPTPTDQSNVRQFLGLFGKLYPCWVCAEDFQDWMRENKIRTESRDEFGRWMCEAHNGVNRKLGKKVFDCDRWEERWSTGWKDGRCD